MSRVSVEPPDLGLTSPKKGRESARPSVMFGLGSGLKKQAQSPALKDEESKKLKEKLSNINLGKKRGSRIHSRMSTASAKGKTKEIPSNNYLWIVFFVKKFIMILKINVLIKKLAKMKTYHYQMIGDKTHFNADFGMLYSIMRENNPLYQNENLKKNLFMKMKENFEKVRTQIMELCAKIEVFQPDKVIVSMWNFIMLFFVFINALYIPLKIGFEIDETQINSNIFIIFEQIPVWVFIFDIAISMNTAYYSKGVFISDRIKILKHYAKTFLLLDMVTIGPYLLGYFSTIKYVEMLFMLRILKLNASIRKLEEFLQLRDLYGGNFQLVKLMGLIFYLAHISCCAWNYLASVEISYGIEFTWLDLLKIRTEHWEVKYVNSLYYAIVTMVTVGYGDITPQNSIEKIFSICYIGMACGVFAYGVNEVGTILRDMYKSENDFK